MLLPRILTALVGIPVVIFAIHLGGAVYAAFIGAVIILSLYEYSLIIRMGKKPINTISLFIFGILMAAVATLSYPGFGRSDLLVPLAINITILGLFIFELFTKNRSLERISFTFLGVFFIPWTLAHMISIRNIATPGMAEYGEYLTIMLFVTVWTCDSAAYFTGRFLGKHKLCEEVSPKKTWEGAVGGFVFAVLVSLLMRKIFLSGEMSAMCALWLGAAAGIVGQMSDLAESVVKRSVGAKDSSNLLPGHGGVLDRFDSYLLLAPVYYYLAVLAK